MVNEKLKEARVCMISAWNDSQSNAGPAAILHAIKKLEEASNLLRSAMVAAHIEALGEG